jgi:DNA polymerase I
MLYIVSVDFDEELGCIVLKLYDSSTETITYHYDTNYAPYFLAEKPFPLDGIVKQDLVERYDALNDAKVKIWQLTVKDPNVIVGLNKKIYAERDKGGAFPYLVWENYIKYFQSYIYDNDIRVGMPYIREKGALILDLDNEAEKRVKELVTLVNPSDESTRIICAELAKLLEYPAPEFKRISLDAEILNEGAVMPQPESAIMPIISVCMQTNTGEKFAFVLIQENKPFSCIEDFTEARFFSDEADLILAVFEFAKKYPFIITFNGDEFDLPYLATRAARLGIPISQIPIKIKDRIAFWKDSIHIDLYKFFAIRAMQIYAFQQKYKTIDLESISQALLKEGKYKGEHQWVGDMGYEELLTYCSKDADLTVRLTTFNNSIVMNLILVLARLSSMPIENVSRKSISNWIRSMVYYEHRKRNVLIPRSEDILLTKGQTATTALIKGKKYKGAIVVDPVAGVHFNAKVGDFASLYPSIMKNYNLGYSTVNCPHEECKDNRFANMPHWVCRKNRAIESQLIGTLKDLRVVWYKKKGKDKNEPRKEWYSVSEQSIKVICNAAYGVFGDDEFSLYCPPFAEYVTGIGRFIITQTIEHAQSLGLTVLYGDTDSIFIDNPDKSKLDELLIWAKSTFDIDFELDKTYRYVCLSDRKKNYLGVLENGDVDVKGLTAKKKHTPKIFKDAFGLAKKLLAEIQKPEDVPAKRAELLKLTKTTYSMLKQRRWANIEDLAFHVTLSKSMDAYDKTEPQHLKAAKYLISKGFEVPQGSDISYVKTTGKDKVKPASLTKTEEVDVKKYIEFFKSAFIQVLEPLGIDWDGDILGVCTMTRFCNTEQKDLNTTKAS